MCVCWTAYYTLIFSSSIVLWLHCIYSYTAYVLIQKWYITSVFCVAWVVDSAWSCVAAPFKLPANWQGRSQVHTVWRSLLVDSVDGNRLTEQYTGTDWQLTGTDWQTENQCTTSLQVVHSGATTGSMDSDRYNLTAALQQICFCSISSDSPPRLRQWSQKAQDMGK
jgi:hypothetical protein